MCETIEFDRFVGVLVSRNGEAGVVGDDIMHVLHYIVCLEPALLIV